VPEGKGFYGTGRTERPGMKNISQMDNLLKRRKTWKNWGRRKKDFKAEKGKTIDKASSF
jgi:hypothetical protein